MRISEHCYAITGLGGLPPWSVNSGFIVGSERTLVVDTGINTFSAQTIFGYASAIRPSNELLVVNTEQHLDHVGGNSFFRERGIDVWGHALIDRSQADLAELREELNAAITHPVRRTLHEERLFFDGTVVMNPNRRVTAGTEFDLGDGVRVRILLTPGHTPSNITLVCEPDLVVFSGDVIVSGYVPNLEAGNVPAWRDWVQALDTLMKLDAAAVVPGHGKVLFEGDVSREILRTAAVLQSAIAEGTAPTVYLVEA